MPISPFYKKQDDLTADPELAMPVDYSVEDAGMQNAAAQPNGNYSTQLISYLQQKYPGELGQAKRDQQRYAISDEDRQANREQQALSTLAAGLSSSAAKLGNFRGQASQTDMDQYSQEFNKGLQADLAERQNLLQGAQQREQQALAGAIGADKLAYENEQRPLDLANKQQQLAQASLNLQKGQSDLQLAADRRDPNSDYSRRAQQLFLTSLPNKKYKKDYETTVVGLSADDLDKLMPGILKNIEMRESRAQAAALRQAMLTAKEDKKPETKPLSVEKIARLDNARMGLTALKDAKEALDKGDNTFSLFGDNKFTEARRRFEEGIGRMQSGGVISDEEGKRFIALLPTFKDNKEIQKLKLEKIQNELERRIDTIAIGSPEVYDIVNKANTETKSTMTANNANTPGTARRLYTPSGKVAQGGP